MADQKGNPYPDMEEFMKNPAEYSSSYKPAQSVSGFQVTDVYGANEIVLQREMINDTEIRNCQHPYSHGNVMSRSEGMVWEQGNNRYGVKGTCGETAISNQLKICGENFSEKYIVDFARMNRYGDFNSDLSSNKQGGIYLNCVESMVEKLTEGRVSVERVERTDKILTPEWIAEKLDYGHAGLFVISIGLLHSGNPSRFTKGILGHEEPMIDHVVTPLVAVREGETGEVKGFYVCDSGSKDRAYYVESDQLMKALNVKNGMVFFTKESYLQ